MSVCKCHRETLVGFLQDRLEEDDRLDFLIHLDSCPRCWEVIYSARKAAHPHFYTRPLKPSSFPELEALDTVRSDQDSEVVF